MIAYKQQSRVKSQTTDQPKCAEQNKKNSLNARGRYSATGAKVMATDSQNVRPGKDQKGLTPVSQSNQKTTCAMVAKMVKRLARV